MGVVAVDARKMSSFQFSQESQSHFFSEPDEKKVSSSSLASSSSSSSTSTPPKNKKSENDKGKDKDKKDKKKGSTSTFPDIESGPSLGVKIKKDKDGKPALKRPDRTGKVKKHARSTGSSSFQKQGMVRHTYNTLLCTSHLSVSLRYMTPMYWNSYESVDSTLDSFIEKIPCLRGKLTAESLKKYCLATAIIIILIIPAVLNIEIEEVLGQRNKEDYNAGAPQAPVGEIIGRYYHIS